MKAQAGKTGRATRRPCVAAAVFSGGVLIPSMLCADSIWLDKPTGAPIFGSTKISRIEKGSIYFLVAGNQTSRELTRVARISVDDEPALNRAEEAFAAEKWDDAVDHYEKVSRSSAKPWLREWAATRLIEASSKSGRFDSAVAAYVAVVMKDPTAAAGSRPALPPGGSTYLDTAAQQVTSALANTTLTDAQRTALLTFLVDIHDARNDSSAAGAAAAKLDEVLARDPNNPAAAQALVRKKLQSAGRLIDQKQFAKAIQEIESAGASFTEPEQQCHALYLLAEARAGVAAQSGDPAQLKDAALAYMRVVAHFKDLPARGAGGFDTVVMSLMNAADICQRLDDRPAALRLYEEALGVAGDDGRVTAQLRQTIERLKTNN